jgi:RNase P subunit RPR2
MLHKNIKQEIHELPAPPAQRALCQACGAELPPGHPFQLTIRTDDHAQQYFIACCADCIAAAGPPPATALKPEKPANARSSRNSRR